MLSAADTLIVFSSCEDDFIAVLDAPMVQLACCCLGEAQLFVLRCICPDLFEMELSYGGGVTSYDDSELRNVEDTLHDF